MIWGLAFAAVAMLLFNYHRFGAHVCCVGDNPESSQEMGINVPRVKTLAFIYVGIAAGMAGVLSGLNNQMFYPGSGEDLLMPVLAAAFIGGTPTWGGVGTVVGAVIGACSVGVIEAGVVAAGVSHLYKNFFYGLIIILAMSGHKLNEPQYR
jgi:simple sugar transport system permease protein